MFPNLIKHIIHNEPELPPFDCLAYEYIFASNGIFLRAENRFIKAIIPIVKASANTVRGLHPLAASITPKVPLMPSSLLRSILVDARHQRSDDHLLEVFYRFHYDGHQVRVDRPSQDTTATSVKTAGDGGADVILEIHSHRSQRRGAAMVI